jgi:hypothetical protein
MDGEEFNGNGFDRGTNYSIRATVARPVSLARFKLIDTRAATGRYHAIDAALPLSMAIERPIMPRNRSHYGIIALK